MATKFGAFLLWFLPALVVAVALARASVWVQPHFSPLILFPLIVGALLGGAVCGLLRLTGLRSLPLAVAGTVIVAIVTAAAEHGFFYLDYRRDFDATRLRVEQKFPLAAIEVQPSDFLDYMRLQAAAGHPQFALWWTNAALMALAAAGVVVWYLKSLRASPHPKPVPKGEGITPSRDANQS